MPAPQEVSELVKRFDRNRESYRSSEYNETQARREFIDPFFKALGWDIDNEQGYAEAYKDVVHEDAIKIGGATKAPDYAFRIGGARKFFVEAKRPGVDIKNDPDPAYQLRRYAWSAKLPLSILTDFSDLTDKAHHDRMVELVKIMLKLQKHLVVAKTNHEKTMLQRQINATDKQIDQLVYEFYAITEEEIKIVEDES